MAVSFDEDMPGKFTVTFNDPGYEAHLELGVTSSSDRSDRR